MTWIKVIINKPEYEVIPICVIAWSSHIFPPLYLVHTLFAGFVGFELRHAGLTVVRGGLSLI